VNEKEYLTGAFSREAAAFVDRHHAEPFFLYLSYNAVHTPMQATRKYLDRFAKIENTKRRTYAAMLSAMDDGVGKVLGRLAEHGIEGNTLLFFINDNGGPTPANASINRPLRGTKGTLFEGGIRVPFMVHWPGRLPAGKTYDHPVIALDIFPTAAAAAGAKLPDDRPLDGVDLLPYLAGKKHTAPHEVLFWRQGSRYAIRKGDWKLQIDADGGVLLYDLGADIGETSNLADARGRTVKDLRKRLDQWDKQLVQPLWVRRRRRRTGKKKRQKTAP